MIELLIEIAIGLIPTLGPLVWEIVRVIELPTLEVNVRSAYSILLGLICASSMLRFILFVYLFSLYVCCSILKYYIFRQNPTSDL